METSTPERTGKKRHSITQKFIPLEESFGDIESELLTRRQEAINKSLETRRRLSAAPLLAGYTASQLTQHCKDVIKLSAENKINTKNAFNFWLIDVMAAMSKKTDSEINKNFQVASCTLDASVKIYGCRVDAIHTDAVKMAGGFFSKEVGNAEEKEEEVEPGEENVPRTKVKKKRKKLTVVPPETLNAKSESEILLDTVPRQNFLSRKTDGNNLLIKIPKYNDAGLLLLDSDYPCWPYDGNIKSVPKFENREIFDHTGLISLLKEVIVSKENCLCPRYKNFEFGKGCDDDGTDSDDDELQTSQNSGRFEFDINASVHESDMEIEKYEPRNKLQIPVGGVDSDEDVVLQCEQDKRQNLAISDMKTKISINPSDYSMFDEKAFKGWAGPAHWKVRPARKPLEDYTNSEDISKPVASKRTRKGKIKPSLGLFDLPDAVLSRNMIECEKTTLFKSTMLNWNPQNTTVPEDLKCKAKNLFSLYYIPSFTVSLTIDGKGNEFEELSDHKEDEEEAEELEYCSASIVNERNDSHHTDEEPGACGGDDAWDLGNMVEAPNRVEKISVSTFRRRKHVDIRHLKKGLWGILTNGKSETEEETAAVMNQIEFAELLRVFHAKVSKNFGSLLSAPLIFNALLHLTNEKNLMLTQDKKNVVNFVISQ